MLKIMEWQGDFLKHPAFRDCGGNIMFKNDVKAEVTLIYAKKEIEKIAKQFALSQEQVQQLENSIERKLKALC